MSTATRPAHPAIPRLPVAPVTRSSDRTTAPDPLVEIARLKKDIASRDVRLASYAGALNRIRDGLEVPLEYRAYVGRGGSLDALCGMAESCERDGRAPALRFKRDGRARIVGVEIAVLPVPREAQAQLDTLPDGMDCIVDVEDIAS